MLSSAALPSSSLVHAPQPQLSDRIGEVDPDRAPGDAAAAPDTADLAELIDPRRQLVHQPLPVSGCG